MQLQSLRESSSQEMQALESQLATERQRIREESAKRLEEHVKMQAAKKATQDAIKQSWHMKVLEGTEKLKMIERESLARMRKREEDQELELESTRRGKTVARRLGVRNKLNKENTQPLSVLVRPGQASVYHEDPESAEDHLVDHPQLADGPSRCEGPLYIFTDQPKAAPPPSSPFLTTPTQSHTRNQSWGGRAMGGLVGAWTASMEVASAALGGAKGNSAGTEAVRGGINERNGDRISSTHRAYGARDLPTPVEPGQQPIDQPKGSHRRGGPTGAEFYGADFSAPSENDELVELEQRRVVHGGTEAGEEQGRVRVEQGTVFIAAMSSIVTRGDEWDRFREKASGDGGGSRRSSRPGSRRESVAAGVDTEAADPQRQCNIPLPPPMPAVASQGRGQLHTVDYSEIFRLDVGSRTGVTVFRIEGLKPVPLPSDEVGTFCVADCYIVLHVQRRDVGSQEKIHSHDVDQADLSHTIFAWIGRKAEPDKRFCAALFSVGLRNWLSVSSSVNHETDHDESHEFLAIFKTPIQYADATEATESSLFMPPKRRYPLRVYMVVGQKEASVRLVEPKWWSLKTERVMIVDGGMELFLWTGKAGRLQHRAKGRIVAERIARLERGGRAPVTELEEGEETKEFWEVLGGRRTKEAEAEVASLSDSGIKSEEAEFEELASRPAVLYRAFNELSDDILSHTVSQGRLKRGMLDTEGSYVLDAGVELFLWLGKAASVACRGSATELLARIVPMQKRPKWTAVHRLAEDAESEIFKLRFSDWEGTSVDINWHDIKLGETVVVERSSPNAQKLRVDVRALYAPPPQSEASTIVVEDTLKHANDLLKSFNTFVYEKGRFITLPNEERGHFFVDDAYVFLCVYRLEEKKERDMREARELRRAERRKQRLKIVTALGAANASALQTGDGPGSASESGSPTSNVGADGLPAPSSSADPDSDTETSPVLPTPKVECVVYFWQGRRAAKLAYSTFKFKTQPELEQLMQDVHKCSVRVVHLEQGKEPIALLAHLDNMWMLHRGSRKGWADRRKAATSTGEGAEGYIANGSVGGGNGQGWSKSVMYHIRTDERYKTARAAEVLPRCSSLVTRDCFFVLSHVKDTSHFLWIGRGPSKDEIRRAHSIVQKIIHFHLGPDAFQQRSVINPQPPLSPSGLSSPFTTYTTLNNSPSQQNMTTLITLEPPYRTITEKTEPYQFFSLLIPPRTIPAFGTEHYYCRPPRFLRCSCSQGYFSVEEITHFTQSDLKSDMCVILDPGAPRKVFCWVGEEASDVVRKLSRKAVDVWLERLDDGRIAGASGAWVGVGIKGRWDSSTSAGEMVEGFAWDEAADATPEAGDGHRYESPDNDGGIGKAREAATKAVAVHARRMSIRGGSSAGLLGLGEGTGKGTPNILPLDRAGSSVGRPPLSRSTTTATMDDDEGDVLWIAQGHEPAGFRAFFLGWDELPAVGVRDPGNRFLREEKNRKSKAAVRKGAASTAAAPSKEEHSASPERAEGWQA
ncbi:hypothetical protein HK097_009729 [Rhizophlyctis rosea]|uniref:Gelsolin-like domain-containing protein n=1 Tax=Rhizophlyctis rosea TaxID=64517 RepID=A0AAD5SIJ3_9FUNG|nr:hypothetical protein HK097_009729 [Rhizophlyctis rosea]